MKTAKRITAFLLAAAAAVTLCACGNNISLCSAKAADKGGAEAMPASLSAMGGKKSEKAEASVNAGLAGTWKGEVDVSPVICDSFESIEGLELQKKLGAVMLPMTLAFTDDGFYIMKFSEKDIDKAMETVAKGTEEAVKDYLNASGKLGKVIIRAVGDETLGNALGCMAALVRQLLANGAAGTYVSSGGRIRFDDKYSYDAIITSKNLTLSGSSGQGMLKCLNAAPVNFAREG